MRVFSTVGLAVLTLLVSAATASFASWHGDMIKRYKKKHTANREKRQTSCESGYVYRTADGTCNNEVNVDWGSNGQVYQRLLDPVYDDGAGTVKQTGVNGFDLVSPRRVSVFVHDFDFERFHPDMSVMVMEWGQFLAHDLAWTPTEEVTSNDGVCCYTDDLVTDSSFKHPDLATGGTCFPIIIDDDDDYFTDVSHRCKEFARSQAVVVDNVRQQFNMLSAYIDGQNVYGHDEAEMADLRANDGTGRLRTEGDYLPQSPTDPTEKCITPDASSGYYCQQAGDFRVNIYPPLGAMHTVFMRYHNYVADTLKAQHGWTDSDEETIFQEARKIVIAVMQKITYDEYLPNVMSRTNRIAYGIDGSSSWSYDADCDATLYNVFATAAFRFGHSMVTGDLTIDGAKVNTSVMMERPEYVLGSLEGVLNAMVTQHTEKPDRWYSQEMTNKLFEGSQGEKLGTDIVSLNIQRGRDHGLPGYNAWLGLCGLTTKNTFADMEFDTRFTNAYGDHGDVNDIDLYSGALEETAGGMLGPLYQCLLGMQFARVRSCDRFWYENTDEDIGFSSSRVQVNGVRSTQQRQLSAVKLSQVLCLTTGITQIQDDVFNVVNQTTNPLEDCDALLADGLDLAYF